jgi:uncharacterized membrane protein YbhN (UPF0104 family)
VTLDRPPPPSGIVGLKQIRIGSNVASDLETANRPPRSGGAEKMAMFAAKLLVTGVCFWYVSRQIDLKQVLSAMPRLDFGWAGLAILLVMLELPVAGLRWWNIIDACGIHYTRITPVVVIAVSAIGIFFGQVLPSIAGEGVRVWLLVRLGSDWRNTVKSVVIDRGVGVGLLVAMGFVILLLPSSLTALGGYRDAALVVYGGLLLAGSFGLLFAPSIVLPFARWRYSRWIATLTVDARRVLLGQHGPAILASGCIIHVLTIVVIWSLGRAQGLELPLPDAAVLFLVMVGVTLVPISISGWGLRELAVVSLLGHHGVSPEKALLFSVCFGLTLAIGSLPGAVVWLFYSFAPSQHSAERGG